MPRVHHVSSEGPPLSTGADALGLIYEDPAQEAEWVAVPASRFDPAFFALDSGLAGEFVQKFANYRLRLAVVGDISAHVDASAALRDFVRESNRGGHVIFVADAEELDRRLAEER